MHQSMLFHAHLTDFELVQRVKSGKKACFEVLMRRHSQALHRMGRLYGLSSDDVTDLMMDAHMQAFRQLPSFGAGTAYRTWITRLFLELLERRLHPGPATTMLADPASRYEAPHTGHRLPQAAAADVPMPPLPDTLRAVYILHEVEGFSLSDTSRLLQLPEAEVQGRLREARASLRSYQRSLAWQTGPLQPDRCDRMVARVMGRI